MALFSRFFGRTVSEAAAFAIGGAVEGTLEPAVQELKNVAWSAAPFLPIEPETVAGIVAEDVDTYDWGLQEASLSGIGDARFAALLGEALNAPGLAELFEAWRRDLIDDAAFEHGLRKAKLEDRWDEPLRGLKNDLLDPGQLAAAIHRGLVPDPGLLKGEQPDGPRNVESYPVYPISPLQEAKGSGYDRDRLGVLVGLQGLPMGPHEAALALFRGIITHGDYIAAFNESNSRNEWAQAVLEQSRQIPTARDFFENALRGYHDFDWALDQAKRHGMSEADATVIYQNQGRPMNVHQITQALSRGGKFHPEPGEITDPYDAAIVEGSLKPAYYDLAKANRYTLPSPFAMRQLASSGVWSEAKTAQRLKDLGWVPEDADEVAAAWAGSTSGGADTHITKARTQLWTSTHRSFLAAESDDATASSALEAAGVAAATVPKVLDLWRHERDLIRKQLTPAQVKKAYVKAVVNESTGAPWTKDEALAELLQRGYSHPDATTFLDT